MIEIRIHGRGGQGVQIAANLLASAAFKEGKYGQSFALFAGDRRGSPVVAFARIDDKRIGLRCRIYHPDHLIILAPTLAQMVDIGEGFTGQGWLVMNCRQEPQELSIPDKGGLAIVDANQIGVELGLGSMAIPIVNTVMLGAFSRVTGVVGLEALCQAIEEEITTMTKLNVAAAEEGYHRVEVLRSFLLSD